MTDEYPDYFDTHDYTVKDGTVVDVLPGGGRVVVRVDKDGGECHGCGVCPMKNLCHGKDVGHLDLPVAIPDSPGIRKDDRLRIAYRPANAALAAFVMFVPALAGLLAGGLAGWRIGAASDWADGILVLGCGAGIALGVVVSCVAARVSPSLKPKTKLLERV